MKNPFLIGSKVYLRPLEREDAAVFVPWVNDPEVTRTLLLSRPMNLRAEEQFIERLYQDEEQVILGIVRRDEDRLIGSAGLHHIRHKDRHTGFGIVIGDKESWDKGYGSEATALLVRHAFDTLNLNRVWLHVFEENTRAIRTYEKVGFRREGVLRQDHYRDGRYGNTLVMGLLREEWEAARR
jgi:RimJ/RimL family protein N-acetyltransferase